jgi:hypothetical protein
MEEVDLKLLLLSGSRMKVDNFIITPYTIEEIKDYGYSNYMMNLQWVSISIDDFIKSVLDIEKRMLLEQEKSKLKTFDFYVKLGGQEMLEGLLVALSMIFKTSDVRVLQDGVIAVDFVKNKILIENEDGLLVVDEHALESANEEELILIHRDNFDNLVEVVKLQNYLTKPAKKNDRESNPADDETRQLMEHMEKMRKKVEEKKRRQKHQDKDDDSDVDISDIISAVTAKSNSINKFNVWRLTLYQLYDEYARLELIDNYDFSIKAMMAGAEKIDLKHWSSKI